MRKVIVNSTPLIALSKVGQLDVLKKLYGEVSIPEAVFREVTEKNDVVSSAFAPVRGFMWKASGMFPAGKCTRPNSTMVKWKS